MRALVFTEILDHSISGDKIYGGSIDLVDFIVATSVDINGGTIDGVSIGTNTAASVIRASSYISIFNGTQNLAVMSSVGMLLYRNGTATPKMLLSPAASTVSYLDFYRIVFGSASPVSGVTRDFQFVGDSYFSDLIEAKNNMTLWYSSTSYNVGLLLERFSSISSAIVTALAASNVTAITEMSKNASSYSPAQWARLAAINQDLGTGSAATFASLSVGTISATGDVSAKDIDGEDISASSSVYGPSVYSDYFNHNNNGLITNVVKYQKLINDGDTWGAGSQWKSSCIQINPKYALDSVTGVSSDDIRSFELWGVAAKAAGTGILGSVKYVDLEDVLGWTFASSDEIVIVDLYAKHRWNGIITRYRLTSNVIRTTVQIKYAVAEDASLYTGANALTLNPLGSFQSSTWPSNVGYSNAKVALGLRCNASGATELIFYQPAPTADAAEIYVTGKIHVINT